MDTTQKPGLSAFWLKLIAIVAMLANHIGSGFGLSESHYTLFLFTEVIGKLTFPIMAFLVAEGYRHTRNIKQYALRLAAFWLASILPFWLLFASEWRAFRITDLANNIFFTLLMGLLAIHLSTKLKGFGFTLVLFGLAFATLLSDWMVLGVFMIYGFYATGGRVARVVKPVLFTAAGYFLLLLLAALAAGDFIGTAQQTMAVHTAFTMWGLALSIPLLLCYNGQRGPSSPLIKWGFYAFYPLHLLALWAIRTF